MLRVIASTPTDLERVLDAIVETAARLSDAPSATLLQMRERDGRLATLATFGRAREVRLWDGTTFETARGNVPTAQSAPGRAYIEGRTLHVLDMAEAVVSELPDSRSVQRQLGSRTHIGVPLTRHGTPIGVLSMQRFEVRAFTRQQIALLETFADQAVIAIENARLFTALQEANVQLAEASQHKSQFLANMSHELREQCVWRGLDVYGADADSGRVCAIASRGSFLLIARPLSTPPHAAVGRLPALLGR